MKRAKCQRARLSLAKASVERNAQDKQHGQHNRSALQQTKDHIVDTEKRRVGIARRAIHKVGFSRFRFEGDGAGRVDDQFQEDDAHGREHERPVGDERYERDAGNRHMDREDKRHRPFCKLSKLRRSERIVSTAVDGRAARADADDRRG
jgi:hypothetical protein